MSFHAGAGCGPKAPTFRNHESFLRIPSPIWPICCRYPRQMATQPQLTAQKAAISQAAPQTVAEAALVQAPALFDGEGAVGINPLVARLPVEVDVAVPIRKFRFATFSHWLWEQSSRRNGCTGKTCLWRPGGRNWRGLSLKSSIKNWRFALLALFEEKRFGCLCQCIEPRCGEKEYGFRRRPAETARPGCVSIRAAQSPCDEAAATGPDRENQSCSAADRSPD